MNRRVSARSRNNSAALLTAVFFFLLLSALGILSEGSYGGADDITHYRFSRYAFDIPGLLLDHWAKPFYTLVAAPFAQFGYNGVRMMNALLAALSGWVVFRHYRNTGHITAWWGMVLCITAPLYFVMAYSGMTEILFGLMLVYSSGWFLRKKYVPAVLAISLLPMVRTEGIILWPLFAVAFILARRSRLLPLFLTGTLAYSIAGGLYYDDFLWLINRMPYTGAAGIYGSGSLFHFVRSSPEIFGIPLILFFLTGLVLFLVRLLRNYHSALEWQELLMLWAPPLLFFAAHSYVWWQGKGGSAGLLRVMVCIIPLMSLGGVQGLRAVNSRIRPTAVQVAGAVLLAVALVWQLTAWYKHPNPADQEMKTIRSACLWLQQEGYDTEKIYYYNPYTFYYLRLNPWDQERIQEKVPDPENPSAPIPPGSVILWDAHFGPNEGRLPAERLQKDHGLELLNTFYPGLAFSLQDEPYRVEVYRKVDDCMTDNDREE